MTRINPYQPSFNAGELSPRLQARTDFAKYASAVEVGKNVVCLPEGGLARRPGTRYVAGVADHAAKSRLRRFEFSTTQAYMLELAERQIRFFRHQAQIVVGATDAAIANGAFTSGITGWDDRSTGGAGNQISHDATNGRLTLETSGTASDDIGWAEQAVAIGAAFRNTEHVVTFRVIGAPSDRVDCRIGSSSTGSQILTDRKCEVGYHTIAFNPGGAATVYLQFRNLGSFRDKNVQIDDVALIDDAPVSVGTPYLEAELFEVEGPQSADTLYLFHGSHPTFRLERRGHPTWSLIEVAWQDGPWLDMNETAVTLTPSAVTGLGITVTASAITAINDGRGFLATDVGRLIRIDNPSSGVDWGWAVITAVTSMTVVVADVRRDFGGTGADTRWRLGAWSGTTGYPRNGLFFEQRLCACATETQPQTFWLGQTGDFETMSPDSDQDGNTIFDGTVEDDDALDYTISADDVNAIMWMAASGGRLVLGTHGGEWVASSQGAVLTPTDVTVRRQTTHGSTRVQPLSVDSKILFLQRARRTIHEFVFSFEADAFVANDMTRLAQHITRGGLVELAYQEEPDSLVWAVREDGVLLSMTYRREEDVVGWTRNVIGGSGVAVESVATIPGSDGDGQVNDSTARDEVWMIVRRTIDGTTRRYIEVLEGDFEAPSRSDYTSDGAWKDALVAAQAHACYADGLITYDGSATETVTGLDHLEGETVKVWADGAIHPDCVVEDGTIELEEPAEIVQVGLGYTHQIKTLKLAQALQSGTAVGKPKQITGISFVLLNAMTLSFGPDQENLADIDFREVQDLMDQAAPLFSGEHFAEFQDVSDTALTDVRIHIESDDPAPFTLLALAPEADVQDSHT